MTTDRQSNRTRLKRVDIVATLRNVSHYFDKPGFVRALTDVSLEVRRGEVLALLGASGSGKSTIIRILAGQLSPSEGKAKVFGRSPRRRAARARVGYLPQHPNHARASFISNTLNCLRDLFHWRRNGLRHPGISPGSVVRDRVAPLKQILISQPGLVLLDEPFEGLDAAGCHEMRQFIQELGQRGSAVVLTGGCLTDARDISGRLAILFRGRIETIGTLPELLTSRDNLHWIVDLLADASAENLLQLIREEFAVPPVSGNSIAEAPRSESARDQTLRSPSKSAPVQREPRDRSKPAINHEMLAALTKETGAGSDPQPENESQTPPQRR